MRILVLGAAVSGLAASRLASREGHAVTVYDERPEATIHLMGEGVGMLTGAWDVTALDGIELVVASPGFSERSVPITDALEAGIPVWSEIEFAWRRIDVPCVAVTGTNGKTTVATLISDMLEASGLVAPALGNIGTPLSAAVGDPLDVCVVEVSSFQLRFTEAFRPDVAVVTNVAPDHLDWHPSFAAYAAAKRRIVANQDPEDLLVYDADDAGASEIAVSAPSRTYPVSGRSRPPRGAGRAGGVLDLGGPVVPVSQLAVDDPAFLSDLAASGVAALAMGASPGSVVSGARGFVPGAHRRTVVGDTAGVLFVDDSKATNPHAALASIEAYSTVVLVAGGLAKGLDLAPLARHPHVRAVVAIGEAGPQLLHAAPDRARLASTMEEAVRSARTMALPGDVVLLAPGCASFDMFESYAARGDAFAEAVSTIIAEESKPERVES